jgi:threonyl-tRNA synthetase
MPVITLPDGSTQDHDQPVTAAAAAAAIGPGLAKAAIGARIDGQLTDLATPIEADCHLEIVTARDRSGTSQPDALYLIRHSCAHVMAEAIQRMLAPDTTVELVYGPAVDNGFYYDMRITGARTLSAEDFPEIEAQMAKIIEADRPFSRYALPNDQGLAKLQEEGSKYKIDNAQRAIDGGSDELTWYATGEPGSAWEDLCRGPHVPSSGRIGAFKVMSLASSYWHGDADSDQLTRVYGTAFADRKQLESYLDMLEEAKKRDHRVLGRQLRLFAQDDAVGPGLTLWTPNGAVVRTQLQNFISEELTKQGYQQVYTPHIGKLELYRTSGHFPYYRESQYPPLIDHEHLARLAQEGCSCADLANRLETGDVDGYLLRPMNCPHHIKVFASQPHSYRDLPVRLAEFGTVYRWEQSGEIGGMTRVRGFTQDDAHLFCTEAQVAQELTGCLELVKIIFKTLNIDEYRVRVSLRDPDSDKYVGDPANWAKAEDACRQAAMTLGVDFSEEIGEAAFYGPKIDFIVKDVLGRQWQLGTVQVDYGLPERFNLSYIGADNTAHRPVMIHRAPFGSMERFVGVLIEHFAGAFPTWLAPEQVRVLTVSKKSGEYAQHVLAQLRAASVRATLDDSNDRLGGKVKVGTDMKIPYLLIVGERDAAAGTVSVRAHGIEQDLGALDLDTMVSTLTQEIGTRGQTTILERHFEASQVSN